MLKHKEEHKCVAPYDLSTGQFPRNNDGSLADEDIYVECACGDMIFDYESGRGILEAHFDSRQRGRAIASGIYNGIYGDFNKRFVHIKKGKDGQEDREETDWEGFYKHVNSLNLDIMNTIQDNDKELWFFFNDKKHYGDISKLMKAKKPKANTSPYNIQYLPAHKEKAAQKKLDEARFVKYETPKGYYAEMDVLVKTLMKEKGKMLDKILDECYKKFGKQIKVNLIEDADKNNYKINHYIHYIGQWDNFVNYVRGMINT